jgi:hypothetical protein
VASAVQRGSMDFRHKTWISWHLRKPNFCAAQGGAGLRKRREFQITDLPGFHSRIRSSFPLSLLPRSRGRRWPTGRMRGPQRKAACEKIPLTLALSPKSFASSLSRFAVCNHANDSGERGQDPAVPPEQIQDKPEHAKFITFAQPRVGPASNASAGPPCMHAAIGGPARRGIGRTWLT